MARRWSDRNCSTWTAVALGLDPRARATTEQANPPWSSATPLRMGVQAMRKVQLHGPLNMQAVWKTATGGRYRDRWSTEARTLQQLTRSGRRRIRRSRCTQEGRSSTLRSTGCRPNAKRKNQLVKDWTQPSTATKRAKAAWEKARAKYQEAEAGVAAAACWSMHSKRRRCCGNNPAPNARRRTARPRTG